MTSNEKMQKLAQRYHDKSLSRAERREAYKALELERYRADKRKPISLRLYTLIDCIVELFIGFSCIAMFFDIKYLSYLGPFNNFLGEHLWLFGLFYLPAIFITVYFESKYKKSLYDELSYQNMSKANSIGFIVMSSVLLISAFLYFTLSHHKTLVITSGNYFEIIFGFFWLVRSASKIIFLILDYNGSKSDDDFVGVE